MLIAAVTGICGAVRRLTTDSLPASAAVGSECADQSPAETPAGGRNSREFLWLLARGVEN
jgi:hypothetical protein